MAKKDGVLSIGFEYKSELEKMVSDVEDGINSVSKNNKLSKGMKAQLDNIIDEFRSFKAIWEKEYSKLGSGKVNQSTFKSFKQTIENKFKSLKEIVDKLELDVSALNSKIDVLGNGINLENILKQFYDLQDYITRTNDAVEQLIDKLGNQGISLFSVDEKNVSDVEKIIKKIDEETKKLDKDVGAKFDLFDEDQAQNELNKLAENLYSTLELIDKTEKKMSNIDTSSVGFKKMQGELALLQLQAASLNDTIEVLYETAETNGLYIAIDDENHFDAYEKHTDDLKNRLDSIVKSAENAKNELSELLKLDVQKQPAVKVSSEMNTNSNRSGIVVTIETTSSELWENLSKILVDLQNNLNKNPVVAPVKLVVSPTAVSNKNVDDIKVSNNYSKKYAKVLAQSGEDAVIDLDGVYKKTFTSIMDEAVSYAEKSIGKIQEIFNSTPISVSLDISQEDFDKIQNFVLSNKDGKKIDISGQITKSKHEIEELNQNIEKTHNLLQNIKTNGNVTFDGFDKFTKDISKSIGKLDELHSILKALQNVEITLAKTSGLSSITEIETQWESLEKLIVNATKLDGNFRKNANIGKIVSEYKKYIDMGGTNQLIDISKIQQNEDTINAIISKAKEFKQEDFTNDSPDQLAISLDNIIDKFNELIQLTKDIGNTFYVMMKDVSVTEVDKQWSSISEKFKSIANESDKINLSKQKKDIQELMEMYQKYVDMGGVNALSGLTENSDTVAKLEKTYKKLNEVKPVDTSPIISKESESFKEVEESVDSLTTAIGDTKVKAINVEADAMENAANREVDSISSILGVLEDVIEKLNKIKEIKIPKIKIENITVAEHKSESTADDLKEESEALKQTSESAKNAAAYKEELAKANEEAKAKAEENARTWKELTDCIKRYSEVSKRVTNGKALDGDIEEIERLEEKIIELQDSEILSSKQLEESYRLLTNLSNTLSDIYKKVKQTSESAASNDINNKITAYTNTLSKYKDVTKYTDDFVSRVKAQLDKLNELKGINITNPEDVVILDKIDDNIKEIISDSKLLENRMIKQESKLADIISKMEIYRADNTNMSKSQGSTLDALIDATKQLEDTGEVSAKSIDDIRSSFSKLKADVSSTGREGLNLIDRITQRAKDMNAKFFAQFFSWQDWVRYLREAFDIIRELDTALVDLKKTTTMSQSELNKFYFSSNDVAKQMGVTTDEIIKQASAWSRLGYSTNEQATAMAKLSSQFAAISPDMDLSSATDGLVSSMKAFDIEVTDVQRDIMDNINRIGKIILPKHIVICGTNLFRLADNYIG